MATLVKPITSIIFSISDKVGALQNALTIIKKHQLNLFRIDSDFKKEEIGIMIFLWFDFIFIFNSFRKKK